MYSKYYGIKCLIFRISNVYGEGCRPYYNSVISTFIDLIFKKEKITIKGDGRQSRDFIYISDVINAFLKSLEYHFKYTDTLNVCTGIPISINKIINILEEVTGIIPELEYKKAAERANFLVGNPSKMVKLLGHKAEVSLEDGLAKMLEQIKRQQKR